MTAITFIGTTTGVSGNNAPLTPTIHGSAAAGDLIVLCASIRSLTGVVGTPAGGWSVLAADGNVAVFAFERGASNPPTQVTFTGGAAGDDTLAFTFVLRTAAPYRFPLLLAITNTSAQNIALPPPGTPDRDASIVIAIGVKQDDWTAAGVATLAGMTEIQELFSTAGNDAGMVADYVIQTTAAATPAGPFVVTGGAAAISKAYLLAIPQKAFITAVAQDVFPPRVLITVSNLVLGDQVAIYRVVAGERTLIRAGSSTGVTDPAFLRVDAELPFGVPVSYVATVEDMEVATAAVTYTLPGGRVALTDAITGDSAEVVVGAWPDKRWDPQATVLKPGNRNVVVSGDPGQYVSELELVTETDVQRDQVTALFRSTTSGVFQLRSPNAVAYPGADAFLAVLSFSERRWSQDGTDPRRLWTVAVAEVDGWAPELEAAGFTYADLELAYTGLTYATLAADYATYLALAQADLS